MESDRGAGHSN